MILNNLGNISFNQGCFDSAIEHYNQSLELKNKITDEKGKWASYHNLGKSYLMIGDLESGIEFLLKALHVQKVRKNQIEKSNTLVELISAYLSLNDDNMAKYYHLELFGIRNITMNKIVDLYYRYSKGLIYSFYDTENFVKLANQEFLDIINDTVINHEITTVSLIRLCHHKIHEIDQEDVKSEIRDIQYYIDELLYLSKLNRSYSLNAEGLLLQSMINKYLDFDELSHLQLVQAELLIVEQNLLYLIPTLEDYKLERAKLAASQTKDELLLVSCIKRINNMKNHI